LEDDVNESEQKEPNHINEVPVPRGRFEAEMLLRRKPAAHQTRPTYEQEDRSDEDMQTVKTRGQEEG